MKQKILFFVILIASITSQAKTEKVSTRIDLEFRKDFLQKFNFNISPELRLIDLFRVDEYMIDGQLSYNPFLFLSFTGGYRARNEINDNVNSHRFALEMQASQIINRFSASLRTFYTDTNYSNNDEAENYFRPRFTVDYDIKDQRLFLFSSYEIFHNLKTEKMDKSRLDIGLTQMLGKLNRVEVSYFYRLEHYFTDNESIHILRIDYRLQF